MNKTVLFLMNGFGIEQIDSYSVYDKKLTPKLDEYTSKELFTKLECNSYDLMSAYRTFSTCSKEPLTSLLLDSILDKLGENNNFKLFLSTIKENAKLHIFFSFESEKNYEHAKKIVELIKKNKPNQIYIHLILTSHDYNSYKELDRLITKFIYDLKDCKVGVVIGENLIKNNEVSGFINMFEREIGENWKEITKKCQSLIKNKVKPVDVKEFYMNAGFKIDKDDSILFCNYEYYNISGLVKKIQEKNYIEPYSLFGLEGIKYPILAYPKSGISMLSNLNKINAKALVLSAKENINAINYYCNGLVNQISDSISFSRTDNGLNPNQIKSIIKNSTYDLIIINYPIDNVDTIPDLKDKMKKLDSFLEIVYDFCVENDISLFISSLFGMQKTLKVDNYIDGHVDFMGHVPLIVVDKKYDKSSWTIGSGGIYDLATTIFKNINSKFEGQSLLKQKGSLEKMLKK